MLLAYSKESSGFFGLEMRFLNCCTGGRACTYMVRLPYTGPLTGLRLSIVWCRPQSLSPLLYV